VVFLAGMSWWLILAAVVGLAAFIPIMWMYLMHDYQRMRVLTLLDPEKDPLGAGYHILQSKIAIGSGGISGKGWMQGTQSQLEFLPEPHTDFIFAVMSEEHGMVGFLILMAIYLFIIIRGLIIAVNAETSFGRILAGATTLIFFVYVFVNIGMVSGILPVVGVPLPLFSYGGTSYVAIMAKSNKYDIKKHLKNDRTFHLDKQLKFLCFCRYAKNVWYSRGFAVDYYDRSSATKL